jgi:hypothetical protein
MTSSPTTKGSAMRRRPVAMLDGCARDGVMLAASNKIENTEVS